VTMVLMIFSFQLSAISFSALNIRIRLTADG